MKYWEDMHTKWGFGDGEVTPNGVELYRTAYVSAVNALAERLGSGVRAVAYNRPGFHNFCLIVHLPVESTAGWPPEKFVDGSAEWGEDASDEAFESAIAWAYDAGIDGYVAIKVELDMEGLVKDMAAATRDDEPCPCDSGHPERCPDVGIEQAERGE